MRFEHWEKRLAAMIKAAARQPFEWGSRDCAMFAALGVWCLTQKDAAATWRGKYSDEAGALRFIAAAGGLAALAEQGMNAASIAFERVDPRFGQRGDPCLFTGTAGDTLGIVEGETLVALAPVGLHRQPFDTAKIVWAIR